MQWEINGAVFGEWPSVGGEIEGDTSDSLTSFGVTVRKANA